MTDRDEQLRALVERLRDKARRELYGCCAETDREIADELSRILETPAEQLSDAQRGDPDGHLLAVYQVLTGSQDAGELFDGEEPHYERVVRAAKEMRAEAERLRAAGRALLETLDKHSTGSFGEAEDTLRELTTPPAPVVRYGDVRFTELADPVTGEPMWRKETAPVERKDDSDG